MDPMRPRFELVVPFPPQEVFARLDRQLACQGCPCRAVVAERTVEVKIAERLRHVWSPWLSLEVEAHPDGARLNGLFGPNPSVWTGILAGYAFLFFAALFGGMLGLSQMLIGAPAWALWSLPVAAVLALVPYGASQIGQRKAAGQMELLRCFLREALALGPPPSVAPDPACEEPMAAKIAERSESAEAP